MTTKPRHPHRHSERYDLRCRICGAMWAKVTTIGEIQRQHFMQKHDTAKVEFELVDVWTGRSRPLS